MIRLLAYHARIGVGFPHAEVERINRRSRREDTLPLTGCLFHFGDYFVHVLEGHSDDIAPFLPESETGYDPERVVRLVDQEIEARSYSRWTILWVPPARWARERGLADHATAAADEADAAAEDASAILLRRERTRASPFLRVMPQQERAWQTIDRLLNAVTAMLSSASSVERLTLEDAAARAGVTQQSAYRYFASIDDLIRAAIRRMQLDWHVRFLGFMTSRRLETEIDVANAAVAFIAGSGDTQFRASPRLKQELLQRHHDLDYDMNWAMAEAISAALPPRGPKIAAASLAAAVTSLLAVAKSLLLRNPAELRRTHVQLMMIDIFLAAVSGPLQLEAEYGEGSA